MIKFHTSERFLSKRMTLCDIRVLGAQGGYGVSLSSKNCLRRSVSDRNRSGVHAVILLSTFNFNPIVAVVIVGTENIIVHHVSDNWTNGHHSGPLG